MPVMVYGRSGRRSARAAWLVLVKGYRKIINLDGGMLAYCAEGY